ncbi:hypothetical protein Tco_1555099, partial [Tanacetum coccineum]
MALNNQLLNTSKTKIKQEQESGEEVLIFCLRVRSLCCLFVKGAYGCILGQAKDYEFACAMQCNTTGDAYQFSDELEMSLVENPELFTPPPDEGFPKNVRRRLTTSQSSSLVNATRLIRTSKEDFQPADILGNHDTPDTTTVPVRIIFDRFRNMPMNNIERDSAFQAAVSAIGKRPLSTTAFSHAYAERIETPTAIGQTISVGRNIRRCLITAQSHDVVDASGLLIPSELHVHTAGIIRQQCVTDGTVVPISRIFDRFRNMAINDFPSNYVVHTGMMQNAVTQQLFGLRTGGTRITCSIVDNISVPPIDMSNCFQTIRFHFRSSVYVSNVLHFLVFSDPGLHSGIQEQSVLVTRSTLCISAWNCWNGESGYVQKNPLDGSPHINDEVHQQGCNINNKMENQQ